TRATKSNTKVNIGQTINDGVGVRKRAKAATKTINNFALSDSDEYSITAKPRTRKSTATRNRNNEKATTTAVTKTYNTRSKAKGQKSKKNTTTAKQQKKSNTRFHQFEHEQGQRLNETINKIDGEGGILNNWANERREIILNAKKKMDDCLTRKEDNIKKFKLGFENYQSSTTKTLEHLIKLHNQSMKFRRKLDDDLKHLYEKEEYELNEALNHFFKVHKRARKSLLMTIKEDHNIMALKRRLSGL
ncbi:9122_t:CDS:2, partial [Ambispora leptoticha]